MGKLEIAFEPYQKLISSRHSAFVSIARSKVSPLEHVFLLAPSSLAHHQAPAVLVPVAHLA